jgi:hypothetical protein
MRAIGADRAEMCKRTLEYVFRAPDNARVAYARFNKDGTATLRWNGRLLDADASKPVEAQWVWQIEALRAQEAERWGN